MVKMPGALPFAVVPTYAIDRLRGPCSMSDPMRMQPIAFRRELPEPQIEMCGQTTLFPVDLPVLFGDPSGDFPRLCRVEISVVDEPSASVYFAPVPPEAAPERKAHQPVLLACAILVRYLTTREDLNFEEIPRHVDCCFKDTCGLPIVHVALAGQDADGYDFRGVIHRQLNATEEFAVRFSADELARFSV